MTWLRSAARALRQTLVTTDADILIPLRATVTRHAAALASQQARLVRLDAYGVRQEAKWYVEMDRFIEAHLVAILKPDHLGRLHEMRDARGRRYEHPARQAAVAEFEKFGRWRRVPHAAVLYVLIEEAIREQQRSSLSDARGEGSRDVTGMSPPEFESYCARVLFGNGWGVEGIGGAGDQGADIIATRGSLRVVVQCKLYSRPVGNAAVQEVMAARTYHRASHAVVVSNQPYTTPAEVLARAGGVLLLDVKELAGLADRLRGGPLRA